MKQKLSESTPLFGIPLWVLLVAFTATFIVVVFCVILCICFLCYPRRKSSKPRFSLPKSIACNHCRSDFSSSSLDKRLLSLSGNISEIQLNFDKFYPQVNGTVKDGFLTGLESSDEFCDFSLKVIEGATNGLAQENVIGSGGYGIVYLGLLPNNKRVAVKRLVRDSGQPEEFFASQVESIGLAKHKHLVKLLGYCAEGTYRMSVSEYVDNGNLHHWLHEFHGQVSPLTWITRLNIVHGVAEGYVAPDFDSTSTFTEGDDIYGFGVLIMEIVSGRIPLRQSQPQAHLVDWFKSMTANEKIAYVVDPRLPEMPPSMELKQIILVALRCVDPDVNPRLKMRDVICMLEIPNLLLFYEHQIAMEPCEHNHSIQSHTSAGLGDIALDRIRRLSSSNHYQKWEKNNNVDDPKGL